VHLFVIWAILIFSLANWASRSKSSRLGGGSSFRDGGKTAAYKAGIGVSNCGGINVSGSCLTLSVLYNSRVSGIKSVSNLYNFSLNKVVKSFGSSSDSWRQDLNLSARAVMSGTWWYSLNSGSFLILCSRFPSSYIIHLKIAFYIFWLSSFSKKSSWKNCMDPMMNSLPLLRLI